MKSNTPRKFFALGVVMLALASLQFRYFEAISTAHILAFFFATLAAGIMFGRGLTLRKLEKQQ